MPSPCWRCFDHAQTTGAGNKWRLVTRVLGLPRDDRFAAQNVIVGYDVPMGRSLSHLFTAASSPICDAPSIRPRATGRARRAGVSVARPSTDRRLRGDGGAGPFAPLA